MCVSANVYVHVCVRVYTLRKLLQTRNIYVHLCVRARVTLVSPLPRTSPLRSTSLRYWIIFHTVLTGVAKLRCDDLVGPLKDCPVGDPEVTAVFVKSSPLPVCADCVLPGALNFKSNVRRTAGHACLVAKLLMYQPFR